ALYNDMMRDPELFERIVSTVAGIDPNLRLMILSTPERERYETIARRYGIGLIHELFADRHYTPEGKLVPRSEPDAVIHDPEHVLQRIRHYRERGHLLSREGTPLKLRGDSLCVHGDNPEAIALVEALRRVL
ncbi:MAG TPA: LamB/YcsF family protein, partial [Nitratifractor salsuginis]|nr:LamB/YcsF family protein [Nitratifractor salsuginis]